MDQSEVREVYEYLTASVRPERLCGKKNKNAWKAWKRKVEKMKLEVKDQKQPFSYHNSVYLTERRGKMVIVVRENDLEELWEKFHKDQRTGGHQGLHSMINRIQKGYFVANLRGWLLKKIAECPTCGIMRKKREVPPSATMVPEHPREAWQIDYIGQFPCDSKTGHQYALVGIDCFSKFTMVSTTYEQGDRHVWSSLERWFILHGKPKYIFSDNGGPFISDCKSIGMTDILPVSLTFLFRVRRENEGSWDNFETWYTRLCK